MESNVKNALRDPPNIPQTLRNPEAATLLRLIKLTRHFHDMSACSGERSNFHQWYYRLACECERRGYNLTRVLRGKNAKDHS